MYKVHEAFSQPQNPEQPIWRYQDLAKFIHLIQAASLHFARVDQLGDPFEGSVSKKTIEKRERIADVLRSDGVNVPENISDVLTTGLLTARAETYINCWHMNSTESAAMWALYSKGFHALAVQSTFRRLSEALKKGAPRCLYRVGGIRRLHRIVNTRLQSVLPISSQESEFSARRRTSRYYLAHPETKRIDRTQTRPEPTWD